MEEMKISHTNHKLPPIQPVPIFQKPSEVFEKLSRVQEFKVIQTLLGDLKYIMSFDEDILVSQTRYWMEVTPIVDSEQRNRISEALERHCHTPVVWLDTNTIEVIINPNYRIDLGPKSQRPPVHV